MKVLLGALLCAALTVTAAAAAPDTTSTAGKAFDQKLELQGITFHVTSANAATSNTVRIVPSGGRVDSKVYEEPVNGTVTGAEVEDLNSDGSPEVYVYAVAPGARAEGSVVAYSANKGRSITPIYLPPVADDAKASKGYRGRDDFAVVETTFVRRFPVYGETDPDDKPGTVTRQIQYKLKQGEAAWQLKVDKVVEY